MAKFTIEAKRTIYASVVVEADSLEEAERLYDYELTEDDYEIDNSDWQLIQIIEEATNGR